jgi:phospholipid/cholesterol/gamma-HCH transport system substrate-binding protein
MRKVEYHWSQIRVGLFVAITGVILFAAIFYFGLVGSPLAREATVYVNFEDFSGLAVGSPVEMGGVQVGQVVRVDLPDVHTGKLPVTLSINREALLRLGESSYAFTSSHALVGQRFVGLSLRKPTEVPLQDGAVVKAKESAGFEDLADQATQTLKEVRALISDLKNVTSTLSNVAMQIDEGHGTIGQLVHDEKLYSRMTQTAGNLRDLTSKIVKTEGPLVALLSDEKLAADLRSSAAALTDATQRMKDGKSVLGKLTTDVEAGDQFGKTLANFESVSAKLNDAQGTLGSLISDPVMLSRVNQLLGEMDSLASDIRRNPQRYLRVQAF